MWRCFPGLCCSAPARCCLSVSLLLPVSLPRAPQLLLPSVEMHPSDVRKKRQGREIPLYGSNQENGDLSWRLTVLLLSVCFSCHEIQSCELRGCSTDLQEGAVIKLFKSPFGFWRASGNSPGDEVYFSPLVPGFEQFPFFSLLKAGLLEKPLLKET